VGARIRLELLGGYYSLLVGLTTALGTACVLWIGVHHVRAGTLTLGSLLLVISYTRPTLLTVKNHRPQSHLIANTLGWSRTVPFRFWINGRMFPSARTPALWSGPPGR